MVDEHEPMGELERGILAATGAGDQSAARILKTLDRTRERRGDAEWIRQLASHFYHA